MSGYADEFVTLHVGDCLDVMLGMDAASIDAIVTDPPAGISFMGRAWDHDRGGRDSWVAWMATIAAEALRVAKPGAHALVWSLPRTSHWTATAWEDAGWEVRDRIGHIFGSGFPKSLDVSKAIDKEAGAERGEEQPHPTNACKGGKWCHCGEADATGRFSPTKHPALTEPAAAAAWTGFGTALKPAVEDWWLLRKPLERGRTVASNVLEHGTGALNIDATRIGMDGGGGNGLGSTFGSATIPRVKHGDDATNTLGRWPAHLTLSWPEDEYELRRDVTPDQFTALRRWLDENA